jgi:hypothetical protein
VTAKRNVINGFDPDHYYYDQLGNPITIEQWALLREQDRNLRKDAITLPGVKEAVLITAYLGFVYPEIYDARLFGSAIIADGKITQIQVYDREQDALIGHFTHLEANGMGLHCNRCRNNEDHQE